MDYKWSTIDYVDSMGILAFNTHKHLGLLSRTGVRHLLLIFYLGISFGHDNLLKERRTVVLGFAY